MDIKNLVRTGIEKEAKRLEKHAEQCTLSDDELDRMSAEVWSRLKKELEL